MGGKGQILNPVQLIYDGIYVFYQQRKNQLRVYAAGLQYFEFARREVK